MDDEIEEDSEFSFTLFSDIEQNVLAMREHIHEEVSDALREELKAEIASHNTDNICNDQEDEVPLQDRIAKLESKVENVSCPKSRTKITRGAVKRKLCEDENPLSSEANSKLTHGSVDIIEMIYSSGEESEVEVLDTSCELNFSKITDSSLNEITVVEDDDDDDDKIYSVKINWMGLRVHKFEVRKFQKFATIFKQLAELENVPKDKILLILRDKIFISQEDCPDSLKISIADIIEGGITKETFHHKFEHKNDLEVDKNMLQFKCVLKDQKKPLIIGIRKTDNMNRLMMKASEQLERPLEDLKFMFEGETLERTACPADLDLEGGEVIHVYIKS